VARDATEFTLGYAADLFLPETIEGLADQYRALLVGVSTAPDTRCSRLSLLDEAERAVVRDWGQPSVRSLATPRCLHELVAEQASVAGDRVALVCGDQQLSYGELDRRAAQLAANLAALGAGPDLFVGVFLERSIEMVIALVAVLKAGSAYLPIEPGLPADRIAFMLADAAPPVVITQCALRERLSGASATILCVDEPAESWLAGTPARVTPEHLAYCIYTSGSTGRPKGVLVTHANATRLLATTRRLFEFSDRDVWTMFHSFAFDFSVWEVFGCLASGGCLVIVPARVAESSDLFFDLVEEHSVTVLNMTPSAFRQFAAVALERRPLAALRFVIFGGEAMYPASLAPWAEAYGWDRPALVNMYGITETTVHVTYRRLHARDAMFGRSPIGVPLDDLGIAILDAGEALVPRGIPGEMYIRGGGVSRGYLNLADLTDQRFVSDPDGPGRLYRTGDLARLTRAGELEYFGRCDEQVKLRGYRIELGEIEACLSAIDAIAECAVCLVEDQLVACLLAKPGRPLVLQTIRGIAARKLPQYMVPARFIEVSALPLNANGKLDRRRVLALIQGVRPDGVAFTPPTSDLEIALAALWERVLEIRPIGASDNFFELGGDSLRGVQVVRQAREHGIEITVGELLTTKCLGELAAKARITGESQGWP
jgi:amino acid adenylation domain-containing protein